LSGSSSSGSSSNSGSSGSSSSSRPLLVAAASLPALRCRSSTHCVLRRPPAPAPATAQQTQVHTNQHTPHPCLPPHTHTQQITALKNLNLNIRKAALAPGSKASTFYITDADTSEKVLKSARLEEIRMTIINNMLYYHPVSSR
jgi:hypothetical protein